MLHAYRHPTLPRSYPELWASPIVHFFPVCPGTCRATVWMYERLQWVWESGAERQRPPLVWMFDSDPPPSSALRPYIFRLFESQLRPVAFEGRWDRNPEAYDLTPPGGWSPA